VAKASKSSQKKDAASNIPINLELFVGGKLAAVTYKGGSGCCSGID